MKKTFLVVVLIYTLLFSGCNLSKSGEESLSTESSEYSYLKEYYMIENITHVIKFSFEDNDVALVSMNDESQKNILFQTIHL